MDAHGGGGAYSGPGYAEYPECQSMYPLGSDGVLFMSRMTALRAEDDKEKVADKVRRLLFAATGGAEVGCMRRARSPRRLEFYHDAVKPPRMFHTTKRLGHVLLALLGREHAAARAPHLTRNIDLNPPLLDRSDDHTEVIIDAATIDAVSRSECALGAADYLCTKQLSRISPPEGPPALDLYGPSSFRISVNELKHIAKSAKVATSSPLPPPFLQSIIGFISRPENRTFFWVRRDVPLREFGCEHRWRVLRQYWADQVTAVKMRLACLENERKKDIDPAHAEQVRSLGFTPVLQESPEYITAAYKAKEDLRHAELMLGHLDRLSDAKLTSQQWDELLARIRRSPTRFGFRTLQLAEATLARSLSYLAEAVVLASEHYSMVDGSHHRQNQLCGKTAQPLFLLNVAALSDPHCSAVDMVALRSRLRNQYRLILAQCRHHCIQTVSSTLVFGATPYGVSDACVREASLRALLEVLSTEEASSSITCWYIQVDGEDALKECSLHLERALSHGGVYNDPFTSRYLRCSMVVHNRNAKFLAVEMAKRATLTALVVPTDAAGLLLGAPGGFWEHGRGSAYTTEADVAATTTYLLTTPHVTGHDRYKPERVLYDDVEGWGIASAHYENGAGGGHLPNPQLSGMHHNLGGGMAPGAAATQPPGVTSAWGAGGSSVKQSGAYTPVGSGVASTNRWEAQQKDRFEKLLQNDTLACDGYPASGGNSTRPPSRQQQPPHAHANPTAPAASLDAHHHHNNNNNATTTPTTAATRTASSLSPRPRDLAGELYGDPESRGYEGMMAVLACYGESCIVEIYTLLDTERTARESFDALFRLPPGMFHLAYTYQNKERVVKTEAHFRTFYNLAAHNKVGMDGDLPELRVKLRGQKDAAHMVAPSARDGDVAPASTTAEQRMLPWSPEAEARGQCRSPVRGTIRRTSLMESSCGAGAARPGDATSESGVDDDDDTSVIAAGDAAPQPPPQYGGGAAGTSDNGLTSHTLSAESTGGGTTPGAPPPQPARGRPQQRGQDTAAPVTWATRFDRPAARGGGNRSPSPPPSLPLDDDLAAAAAAGMPGVLTAAGGPKRKGSKTKRVKKDKEKDGGGRKKKGKGGKGGASTSDMAADALAELDDVKNLVGVDLGHCRSKLSALLQEQHEYAEAAPLCACARRHDGLADGQRPPIVAGPPPPRGKAHLDLPHLQNNLKALLAQQAEYEKAKRLREEMVTIELRPVAPGPFDTHQAKIVVHQSLVADFAHVSNAVQQTMKYEVDLFYFDSEGDMVKIKTAGGMETFVQQKWGDLMLFVKPKKRPKVATYKGNELESVVVSFSFNPPVLKIVGTLEQTTIEAVSKALIVACPYLANGRRAPRCPSLTFYAVPKPHWSVTYPHVHLDQTMQSVVFLSLLDTLNILGGWTLCDTAVTALPVDLPKSAAAAAAGPAPVVASYTVDFYKFVLQRKVHVGQDLRAKEKSDERKMGKGPVRSPLSPNPTSPAFSITTPQQQRAAPGAGSVFASATPVAGGGGGVSPTRSGGGRIELEPTRPPPSAPHSAGSLLDIAPPSQVRSAPPSPAADLTLQPPSGPPSAVITPPPTPPPAPSVAATPTPQPQLQPSSTTSTSSAHGTRRALWHGGTTGRRLQAPVQQHPASAPTTALSPAGRTTSPAWRLEDVESPSGASAASHRSAARPQSPARAPASPAAVAATPSPSTSRPVTPAEPPLAAAAAPATPPPPPQAWPSDAVASPGSAASGGVSVAEGIMRVRAECGASSPAAGARVGFIGDVSPGAPASTSPRAPGDGAQQLVLRYTPAQRRKSAEQVGIKTWSCMSWEDRLQHLRARKAPLANAQQLQRQQQRYAQPPHRQPQQSSPPPQQQVPPVQIQGARGGTPQRAVVPMPGGLSPRPRVAPTQQSPAGWQVKPGGGGTRRVNPPLGWGSMTPTHTTPSTTEQRRSVSLV